MDRLYHHFLIKTASLCFLCLSPTGYTQQSHESALVLEEIVITAQKREQSTQDVPSTVTALQGGLLEDFKLFDFADLEQLTPGLDMRSIAGRAGSIALRGVDYNPNSAAAQAVDVYWNDITLGANASGGVFQQMFDIERIEILRGPQGTLQGRSSPGGAVAIHTAQVNLEQREGYVQTTFTDNDGNNTQFAANLPLIPGELGLRTAGVYNESELNETENILDGNISDIQTEGARISLAWKPDNDLSVDLAYQYLENNLDRVLNLEGASTLPAQPQSLPTLDADDHMGIQLLSDVYSGRFENTALSIEWNIADYQLNFVSGYSEVSSTVGFHDNARGNANPNTAAFSNLFSFDDVNFASSQELRLSSVESDVWEYMLGLYYGNESGHFFQFQSINPTATIPGVIKSPFDIQEYGFFSHNVFHLTDHMTAQLGLRWQRKERYLESNIVTLAPFGLLNPGDQVSTLLSDSQTEFNSEAVTGSASISYAFDGPDLMIYLNLGSSYRAPGTTVSAFSLQELATYDDEDSWALEIGFKSTLWNDRLRLNAALYHQEFNSYINRLVRIPINNGGDSTSPARAGFTVNGDARVQGVELDAEVLITENWHLRGGISYTEAEYKSGALLPCDDASPIPNGTVANRCDVGGQEIGSQPRFSANLSSDYSVHFERLETYVQVLYKFVGRRTDTDAPGGSLGGYGTIDLHLGVRHRNGSWDLSLFSRNLFDRKATDIVEPEFQTRAGADTGYRRAQVIPQRLVGVSILYSF